jgi:hypothetical protein
MHGCRGVKSVAIALSGIAALSVTACSRDSGPAAEPAAAAQASVPAGVAAQYATVAQEIRDEGGETTVGEWRVGYIVEQAEPWHQMINGSHSYREPATGETHHLEIIPFEASTGRIVPDVPIRLQVIAADGRVVDDKQLTFYYGEFFHYANNFSIPEPGRYTLRAQLVSPPFPRHGESNQPPALADGVSVEFKDVEFKP